MANLFETKYEDKQRVIDESVIYTAFIVTTINKNGHTVCVLYVCVCVFVEEYQSMFICFSLVFYF